MAESDGVCTPNTDMFRDAVQIFFKWRQGINDSYKKNRNYQGSVDWSGEEQKMLKEGRARLDLLAAKLELTPGQRKEIEDDVVRELLKGTES